MRVSISNIAWDVAEDQAVARELQVRAVDAIDVAPGKYFPDPQTASDQDIEHVRHWWAEQGIAIVGMQALLFGTQGLNLFGSADVQRAMLAHLGAVCRIGGGLGATRLVFGSPRNRDRTGLADAEAHDIAAMFFRQLGDIARNVGVTVCLEPNPPRYGANFMTTANETAAIVDVVAHPAIRMQLDTGAMAINGESIDEVLSAHADRIGHVHASEPGLVPLGDGGVDHGGIGHALERRLPEQIVTIEMLATDKEPHLDAIRRALDVAIGAYRNGAGVGR